jgi:hypothetical protein
VRLCGLGFRVSCCVTPPEPASKLPFVGSENVNPGTLTTSGFHNTLTRQSKAAAIPFALKSIPAAIIHPETVERMSLALCQKMPAQHLSSISRIKFRR